MLIYWLSSMDIHHAIYCGLNSSWAPDMPGEAPWFTRFKTDLQGGEATTCQPCFFLYKKNLGIWKILGENEHVFLENLEDPWIKWMEIGSKTQNTCDGKWMISSRGKMDGNQMKHAEI
jgi:hypothetical protein